MDEMHFGDVAWVDFVRGALGVNEAKLMQQHLIDECGECLKAHAFWTRITDVISREPEYEPDASDIRVVKAAFAHANSGMAASKMTTTAQVIFDSFRDAAPAGFRSALMHARYLVFRSSRWTISVRIKSDSGNQVFLAGHITERESAEGELGRMQVTLLNGAKPLETATTNRSGEFHLQYRDTVDVRLLVKVSGSEDLEIRLPDQDLINDEVSIEE
jgi:hypothetical protein